MKFTELRADVLVIGGAITGLWAAIRAKELAPESEVMLIDKGSVGKSGCANWAGGTISLVLPEDNLEEVKQYYLEKGAGLSDPDWLHRVVVETYKLVMEMEKWGVPFEKDSLGNFVRRRGRGGGALSALCSGRPMLQAMRRKARSVGVKIVDKVTIVDLIRHDERFSGAVGFKIGQDEILPYVFFGGSLILAAGPCSFKASYIGHRMATGDGIAAALRHGAVLMGMEFAVGHNTGPRLFDVSGMGRFVDMGGIFLNGLGKEFMHHYDPVWGNRSTWDTLLFGMASEVGAGRGPICFDLSGVSEENYNLMQKLLDHTFVAFSREGLDLRKDRIEWVPGFAGNRGTAGGLRVTKDLMTTLPGVFAGGDTAGKYHYGANAGLSGMNFAWCAYTGYHAAQAALEWSRENKTVLPPLSAVNKSLDYLLAPARRESGVTPDEVIVGLQKAIIPYDVVILKNADRLTTALEEIRQLKNTLGDLQVGDSHELMKAHEAINMVLLAETIVKASLLRTESRGIHHRVDYPQRDDEQWQKWLYCRQEGEGLKFWIEE